ncbi:MAG: hypothetical protein JOY54_02825 [Acidobacteriaceae bacterium]|nr:hypothetical protein [Acidobacteriaceae bacterium]
MTTPPEPTRSRSGSISRSSSFKYYIHDGTDACRLQLIGELTETEVTDLDGCWRTARTTLGSRKLVLDVHALARVDEAAKQWLAAMAVEGAHFFPDSYLRGAIASDTPLAKPAAAPEKLSFWGRILGWLRGSPVTTE